MTLTGCVYLAVAFTGVALVLMYEGKQITAACVFFVSALTWAPVGSLVKGDGVDVSFGLLGLVMTLLCIGMTHYEALDAVFDPNEAPEGEEVEVTTSSI